MLGLLSQILCWIKQIGAMVADAGVRAFNAVIEALAEFLQFILDELLPGMPDFPDFPGSDWLTFFVPVSTLVGLAAQLLALYLAFAGAKVALRFVKAL